MALFLRRVATAISSTALAQNRRRALAFSILIALLLILGIGYFVYRSPLEEDQSEPAQESDSVPIAAPAPVVTTPEQDEPLATRLSDGRALTAPYNGQLVAFVRINDLAWGITRDRIVNVTTQESLATPEPIRAATAMDDLDAIFLLGESGTLHMFTIANKKFETSALPLPAGAQADSLGAYLTYLYVLDRDEQAIYRFPRSEGGFGAPVTWSKETLQAKADSPLVVSEMIALIGEDNAVGLYERGKRVSVTFGGTRSAVVPSVMTFDKASTDLLVLDRGSSRVVRYRVDGTLVAQYFHASFRDASALLMGPGNTLLVVRPDGTFAFQLP